MKISTAIILDTRKKKKDGTYPVKLRITQSRQQKYYSTIYNVTADDFEKITASRPRGEYKELALSFHFIEKKAKNIIQVLPFFTWPAFEKQFFGTPISKTSVSHAFKEYAKELRGEGRIGTAVSYECAERSLGKFLPGAKFTDITPDILKKYEKWMLGNGKSVATVGMYLRSLRTLYNNAISEGTLTKDLYPFGKKKFEIPTGNNIKKALPIKDIALIYNYDANPGIEAICKDYWVFMYLCFGINVKDMCLLRYKNIKGNTIEFERAKTVRTKRKVEPIRVPLTEELKNIIEGRSKAIHQDENAYIFPVLTEGLSPERERQLIQQLTQLINAHMKAIAAKLGIKQEVTTYAARHSFATILLRSGASTEFIRESLGHGNLKTTQNYLAGFENEHKVEVVKALTAFNN